MNKTLYGGYKCKQKLRGYNTVIYKNGTKDEIIKERINTIKIMNYLKTSIAILTLGLMACNQNKQAANEDWEKFEARIQSIEDTIKTGEGMQWASDNWESIEREYQENWKKAKAKAEEMQEEVSNKDAQDRWDKITTSVTIYSETPKESGLVNKAYTSMGLTEMKGSMDFVTADNILETYSTFVTTVDENRSEYSTGDEEKIEWLWDALNDRKNEVEGDISTKDNLAIAKQKARYATVVTALKAEVKYEDAAEKVSEKYQDKKEKIENK